MACEMTLFYLCIFKTAFENVEVPSINSNIRYEEDSFQCRESDVR